MGHYFPSEVTESEKCRKNCSESCSDMNPVILIQFNSLYHKITSVTIFRENWVFFGRTDAKAETPILWPPHAKKSWLFGKHPDAGRDWGQEKKGMTEDEMAGWHHRLDVHEFGWTPGVGDGQGGLACCSSWGHKESNMTERLNWTELNSLRDSLERILTLHWVDKVGN